MVRAVEDGVTQAGAEQRLKVPPNSVEAEQSLIGGLMLDNAGWVTDCILMRESKSAAERRRLIGKVLDRGLAGWVIQHRRAGLIEDTTRDQRWYQMKDQPYVARSALAAATVTDGPGDLAAALRATLLPEVQRG